MTDRAQGLDPSYQHRWIIAITVTLASVLEILDTSIVNVAIPHMMGTLGATLDQITWVSTGYIVANVIVRSEEHTSELQSLRHLVCRLLLEKKKNELKVRCRSKQVFGL